MAIQQVGYAVVFVILVNSTVPWPLISLVLALGLLAIWWDSTLERASLTEPWILELLHLPERWQERLESIRGRVGRYAVAALPILALASLAGMPLTAGAIGRWALYATLLHEQLGSQLIATLIADAFLAAALWTSAGAILKGVKEHRPSVTALVAMVALAIPLLALGIAPGSVDLASATVPDVSVWSLGLLYILPWLVGGWLARIRVRLGDLGPVRSIVDMGWLYRAASWIGQRLVGGVFWLGQVGEGEGWWGWALIVLALGAMLLAVR
jgi:hypothetical protein